METLRFVLQIAILVLSLIMVVLILLHNGKGGGLSSLFGGGVQSSLSGSSVVEKNLDRMTIFVGVLWVVCIVGVTLTIKFAS
jgi:preprotein translocase subunit SecG